jgi:hypothetical protein
MTASGLIVGPAGVLLRHRTLGVLGRSGGHTPTTVRPVGPVLQEVSETGLKVSHVDGTATLVHVDVPRAPASHASRPACLLDVPAASAPRPTVGWPSSRGLTPWSPPKRNDRHLRFLSTLS